MNPAAYNAKHAADTAHGIRPADIGAKDWSDLGAIRLWQSTRSIVVDGHRRPLTVDGRFGPSSVTAYRAEHPAPKPIEARGIDISGNNGAFKKDPAAFHKVKAAGYGFVYIKATQGNTYTLSRLAEWVDLAREAGLDVGVYHFDVPRKGGSALLDADYFLDAIRGLPTTLRPVLDHEEAYQCKRIPVPGKPGKVKPDPRYKLDADALTTWAREFLDAAEDELGYVPTFYTYAAWLKGRRAAFLARTASFAESPLWLAKVGDVPPKDCSPWSVYALWQHSWTTEIPGLAGRVDANIAPRGLGEIRVPTRKEG